MLQFSQFHYNLMDKSVSALQTMDDNGNLLTTKATTLQWGCWFNTLSMTSFTKQPLGTTVHFYRHDWLLYHFEYGGQLLQEMYSWYHYKILVL